MPYCKNCGSELPEGASFCPKCGAALQPSQLQLANWGERFVAWLIDFIIIGVTVGLLRLLAWAAWPGYVWIPGIPSWFPFVDFGLGNVIYFLYWMLMEGTYGQSIGKILVRIKLTGLNGQRAGIGRAAIESIGKAYLLPLDVILGLILYPRRRQRLFNYLAGTIVVRA
jgi:uncharacterized RDD family membrane protein YckC